MIIDRILLILINTLLGIFIAGCNSTGRVTLAQSEGKPLPSIEAQTVPPTLIVSINDPYAEIRADMVRYQIEARGVEDQDVLTAMRSVPRHRFVLPRYLDQAYEDHPLPINYGQTISQPYIVALMTELLEANPGDRVLEIGTGSGYQAAILSEMGYETFSIEIIPELADKASILLKELDYSDIMIRNADGYYGWAEYQPYDAIIVTAAPDHLPQPLVEQLAEGGRLVIPIGPIGAVQTLWLFEKISGELQATNMGAVRFVPLTGEH
jgi:protein-L-isoaspartate(D-aspartate) O-methyltransferase